MRCRTCLIDKDASAFYVSNKTRCKECVKASVNAHRQANLESVRAYDRLRGGQPHRVAARKEYQRTPAFAVSHKAANAKWMQAHPERKRATSLVNKALMRGKLNRLPCFVCGDIEVEGHHPDYSAPLAVAWLCNTHHRAAHAVTLELETT